MLLVGRFQSSLKHRKTALGSIVGLVGIAPISNQELKKNHLTFFIGFWKRFYAQIPPPPFNETKRDIWKPTRVNKLVKFLAAGDLN
jgi:hypothetical protein